jgi:ribose/xylose/arabinose/galactoside ABC-type transport system permease subunit
MRIIDMFKIPSMITSIATSNIFYGLLTVITKVSGCTGFPTWFGDFAQIRIITFELPKAGHMAFPSSR